MEADERTMSCGWLHLPFMMALPNPLESFHWKTNCSHPYLRPLPKSRFSCWSSQFWRPVGLTGLLGFTSLVVPVPLQDAWLPIDKYRRPNKRQKRMVKNLNQCKWSGMMMKRRSWTPYRLPLCSVVPYLCFIKRFLIKISQFVFRASFCFHIYCFAISEYTEVQSTDQDPWFLIFFILLVQTFFELQNGELWSFPCIRFGRVQFCREERKRRTKHKMNGKMLSSWYVLINNGLCL